MQNDNMKASGTNETVVRSSSKFQQTEEILRIMAERALGKSVRSFRSKELGGGMCNAVYLVEADVLKLVLKIAPDPSVITMRHEKDSILNEANMLKIFEEKIDIPAPKLIYLDTSDDVCGAPYFFMSFMEGTPLMTMAEKPPKEFIFELKRQIGLICRKISSLQAESFGIPVMPETYRDNNCDFILTLFRMLLQDASDKEIEVPGISHDELLALIEAERDGLNEVKVPCYIHTDTWDGNLMVKENRLQGLIDYAAVLYGDPLMNHDFHDFGDPCEAFLEGYGKTEFTHNELIRISIYKIWQRLGMIVERGYRNYEDKNQYAWVLGEFTNEVDHFRMLISKKI
ncbi:phosphotransferase family protein [Gorillibacterium massiliense]|uniref:phosphotransferase family protein n=1 Tax=Gorillibacterium massiliense TaxID=1280390 RepID=UPI0004AE70F8|nr:aminoglycoside phosphotransferase family protein [Gorillibacterium massiliense]